MTQIYTIRITVGHSGMGQYYLSSEFDYLEDICYSDNIIDNFRSFAGGEYPTISEIIEEVFDHNDKNMSWYEADEIINQMVIDDIKYERKLSSLDDLDKLPIMSESCLYEDCEEIRIYRTMLLRDSTIDDILS